MNVLARDSGAEKLADQPEPVAESRAPESEAGSILVTCAEHSVALRLDDDGTVVVGRLGAKAEEDSQPWPALIAAIEANLGAVADLVAAGWTLKADWNPSREHDQRFCI